MLGVEETHGLKGFELGRVKRPLQCTVVIKHDMDPNSNLNNSRKTPALSVYSIWFTYVYSNMFHDVPI